MNNPRWKYNESRRTIYWIPRETRPTIDYFLELCQCQTEWDRAGWLCHLAEKNWILSDDLYQLRDMFQELKKCGHLK